MKHSGFSLIETLIATLIASMLAGVLLSSLYYMGRAQTAVINITDMYTRMVMVQHQVERDLHGMFVPVQAELITTTTTKTEEKKEADKKPDDSKKQNEKEAEGKKKKKPKPLENVFFGSTKNKTLNTLSFITNNPLDVYWNSTTGKAKPKVARVVYRIIPDENFKGAHALTRQEGAKLQLGAYKPNNAKVGHTHVLIDGIKEFAINYGVVDRSKKEDVQEGAQKIKRFADWQSDKKEKTEGEDAIEERPTVPDYIEFSMVLWDADYKKDMPFSFVIRRQSRQPNVQKKKEEPKKDTQGASSSGQKPGEKRGKIAFGFPQPRRKKVVFNQVTRK